MLGLGVGEGVIDGGGLNLGPVQPARRMHARSNNAGIAGNVGNGKLRTRISASFVL